jgi:nucleotide-binding universal stress UspA family protein
MKVSANCIVCATDFSENARRAADVAAAIALRLRFSLVLVHVTDQPDALGKRTSDLRILMRKARAQLHKEATRLRCPDLVIEKVLLHGCWAERAVGDLLAKNPPALVVVSSVSKTAFDRWTLGSVSEHISQHSPVPTLVVRAPDRLLAWARQERVLNVVVAIDFTVSSDAALAFIQNLRRVGACSVTVAHINWPPGEQGGTRRQLRRDLQRKVDEFIPDAVHLRLEPNWGRPDAALVGIASETDADLIVIGAHQRHGLERVAHVSVSRGVLRHAPMSVICVPVPTALAHGVEHHPQLQRVLVATDLSPRGDQAIPWAYAMVSPAGTVKLVHVVEPSGLPGPLVPHYEPKRMTRGEHRERATQARGKLAALVPVAAAVAGIKTEIEIVEDRDRTHGIGVAARRFGADVICLATSGRPAVAGRLFGSVVRDVIVQNRQPVLVVKPEAP